MIELSSNDGWNHIELELKVILEDQMIFEIRITSRFWDQFELIQRKDYTLIKDVTSNILQAVILRKKLALLNASLLEWQSSYRAFKLDLSGSTDEEFSVSLSITDRFICSPQKPIFTLSRKTSRSLIETYFVVDQSCLHIFQEGIGDLLSKPS